MTCCAAPRLPLLNRPYLSVDLREADSDGEVVLGVRVLHNQVAIDAGWHLQAGEGEVIDGRGKALLEGVERR